MAVQITEEMLAQMGEQSREQVLGMLSSMKEEKQNSKYRVQLFKLYNFDKFHLVKEKTFLKQEEAEEFAEYISYTKYKTYDKVVILNGIGEVIYNELI